MRKLPRYLSVFFYVVFCLGTYQLHSQSSSADCQDEINISLGSECTTALPWEEFNTWKPSCLILNDSEGITVAAISGEGNVLSTDKYTCSIPIDSIWFDTIQKLKVRIHQIPGWTRNCDQLLNPDTVWIKDYEVPAPLSENLGCNRDTFWIPGGVLIGGPTSPINSVTVIPLTSDDGIPPCPEHTQVESRTDGFFQFRDSTVEYTIEIHNKTVYRVDTFSHSSPLKWIKGTQLINHNGVIDTVHNYKHTPPPGKFIKIGPELCKYPEVYKEDITHINGSTKLKPGQYQYNSYTQDSTNFCWGKVNVEYKLWPALQGRSDTISCGDLTDYSRAESYNYNTTTVNKLEDVCKWAEEIIRSGSSSNPLTAMRTTDYIEATINKKIGHCYKHTVTKKDKYLRNFDWLCDTVVKVRVFYTDHPSHGSVSTKELAQDTLQIIPIHIDSVKFPDSIIAIKCGILPEGHDSPDALSEYLYHSFDHFDYTDKKVIVDYSLDSSKYVEKSPCPEFASQYLSSKQDKYLSWKKVFEHADYNNWGVSKSFPYVLRHVKTIDKRLKAKLIAAGANAITDTSLWTLNYVRVPVNSALCNINTTRIDLEQPQSCVGETQIYRTWTLVDWCNNTTKESTQIIKVVDFDAPVVTALNGQNISIEGDSDDDSSKGREDHYFGRNDLDNHDSNDDLKDKDSNNDSNIKMVTTHGTLGVHWVKVTNTWGCKTSYTFPEPTLFEHCSKSSYSYELLDEEWISTGTEYQSGETADLIWQHGKGISTPIVKLRTWDECNNDTVFYYYLKAIDKLPPVVKLHDHIFVNLTSDQQSESNDSIDNGIAKIYCEDLDAGSHDGDCGPITCELRVKGSDNWGDFVHFDCEDIGDVLVEVRITDYSGNTALGWTTVIIESKNGPFITCEDVIIDCTDPIHPEWLGYPHVQGICSAPDIIYEDDYYLDDLCFKGVIKRKWSVEGTETSCIQTITIDDSDNGGDNSAFDPTSIQWPLHNTGESLLEMNLNTEWIKIKDKNAHGECISFTYPEYESYKKSISPSYDIQKEVLVACKMDSHFECEIGNIKEPTWEDPACGLVGKTFEDQQVTFNDGSCYKIIRSWVVIDWCKYDEKQGNIYDDEVEYVKDICESNEFFRIRKADISYENQTDGYYTFQQIIKIADDTPPVISVEKEVQVEVGEGSKSDNIPCEGEVILIANADDFCGSINISKLANDSNDFNGPELDWYAQLVKINNDGTETTITDADGRIWRPLSQGGNKIGHEELYSHENQSATTTFTFTGTAHETYHVKWRVEDGCSNAAEDITKVTFKDVKAPIIVCHAALSTNTMSTNGVAEIWANDFGQAYDCNGEDVPVRFKNSDGELVSSLAFTCEDLNGKLAIGKEINIYSVDDSGNESHCEAVLKIVDANDVCGNGNATGAALISGNVQTYSGDMTELVQVSLGDQSQMTGADGLFAFDNNPMGLNYRIVASKNDDYLNGVSTLDLVLIQKHILGLDLLDSPYKIIAADVNNDEKVSSLDLVELRKLILDKISELPNNSSWRFADADHVFSDVLNPFPVKENIGIDFLLEDTKRDFISIKVGDVNGNVSANSHISESRNSSKITFAVKEKDIKKGDLVEVTFSSSDFVDITAFQFTLNTTGLQFDHIKGEGISLVSENIGVFDNTLTIAWTSIKPITENHDLFTLTFKAVLNSSLSNLLSIGSQKTAAKVYNSSLEEFNADLIFQSDNSVKEGKSLSLYQNVPNPFKSSTIIGYELRKAGIVKLSFFDITGNEIHQLQTMGKSGYNEITILKSHLNTSGVLYYKMESENHTASRKMISIE